MDRNVLILGQSPLAEALAELIGAAGLVVHRPPAWPETREDLDAIFTDQDRRGPPLRPPGGGEGWSGIGHGRGRRPGRTWMPSSRTRTGGNTICATWARHTGRPTW